MTRAFLQLQAVITANQARLKQSSANAIAQKFGRFRRYSLYTGAFSCSFSDSLLVRSASWVCAPPALAFCFYAGIADFSADWVKPDPQRFSPTYNIFSYIINCVLIFGFLYTWRGKDEGAAAASEPTAGAGAGPVSPVPGGPRRAPFGTRIQIDESTTAGAAGGAPLSPGVGGSQVVLSIASRANGWTAAGDLPMSPNSQQQPSRTGAMTAQSRARVQQAPSQTPTPPAAARSQAPAAVRAADSLPGQTYDAGGELSATQSHPQAPPSPSNASNASRATRTDRHSLRLDPALPANAVAYAFRSAADV